MRLVLATVGVSFLPLLASAHHAFSANYDVNEKGSIEGVMEEVFWANPHVHFYVRVTNQDGSNELWDAEDSNLTSMSRRGWNRNTISVGDKIRISGSMGRDGRRRIWAAEVFWADGSPVR